MLFVSSEPPYIRTLQCGIGVLAVWNLISLFFFRSFNDLITDFKLKAASWIAKWNTNPPAHSVQLLYYVPGDMRFYGDVVKSSDFWMEFCGESSYFFLFSAGVYFLYRPCDFLHAGLDFVFRVFCFGLCCVLAFAAAILFSGCPVTWLGLVSFVSIPHRKQWCLLATC